MVNYFANSIKSKNINKSSDADVPVGIDSIINQNIENNNNNTSMTTTIAMIIIIKAVILMHRRKSPVCSPRLKAHDDLDIKLKNVSTDNDNDGDMSTTDLEIDSNDTDSGDIGTDVESVTEIELLCESQRFKKKLEQGSEYLINIIDLFEDRNNLWIVTNYCQGCNLWERTELDADEARDHEYENDDEEEDDDGNETDNSNTTIERHDGRDSALAQSMDFGDSTPNGKQHLILKIPKMRMKIVMMVKKDLVKLVDG